MENYRPRRSFRPATTTRDATQAAVRALGDAPVVSFPSSGGRRTRPAHKQRASPGNLDLLDWSLTMNRYLADLPRRRPGRMRRFRTEGSWRRSRRVPRRNTGRDVRHRNRRHGHGGERNRSGRRNGDQQSRRRSCRNEDEWHRGHRIRGIRNGQRAVGMPSPLDRVRRAPLATMAGGARR